MDNCTLVIDWAFKICYCMPNDLQYLSLSYLEKLNEIGILNLQHLVG